MARDGGMRMNVAPSYRTLTEIRQALRKARFRLSRFRGQSFLVDQNLLSVVADAAELTPRDVVLEVGSGTGALSCLLADRAAAVVTVEIDETLAMLARRQLSPYANTQLVVADALAGAQDSLNPAVESAVEQAMLNAQQLTYKVAANLPYAIATALVGGLLRTAAPVALMAVTVQREVAERLCADPGDKRRGVLSVLIEATCKVELVRHIPASAFWPSPGVQSALLRIRPDSARRERAGDVSSLMELVYALFTHRRKSLARSLVQARLAANRNEADDILKACRIEPKRRPESLSMGEWVALVQGVRRGVVEERRR